MKMWQKSDIQSPTNRLHCWHEPCCCRLHLKKESSKISRSTSSTCSFSVPTDDTHLVSVGQNTPWCLTVMSLPVSVFIFSSPWQKNLRVSSSSAAAPQVNAQPRLHWLRSTMSACSIYKISDFRLLLWFFKCKYYFRVILQQVLSKFSLNSYLQVLKLSAMCFCFPSTDMKNKNSPRSNLKFRFDKLSHSAAVSKPIRTIHTSS